MKLVRDSYESKADDGFTLRLVEHREEHVALLIQKIYEEFGELFREETSVAGVIEAGDVIEVVVAYCRVKWGLTEEDVMTARKWKTEKLGGFMTGKVWTEG